MIKAIGYLVEEGTGRLVLRLLAGVGDVAGQEHHIGAQALLR